MDGIEEQSFKYVIIIGSLGMLFLVAAIMLFIFVYQRRMFVQKIKVQELETQHQQDLLEATIDTQEEERNRIAQDLHDDIGAMLSTIKLSMNVIGRKVKEDEVLTEHTTDTKKMIDDAIQNVRRISKELLPATLKEFGLAPALEELCVKTDRNTDINVAFTPTTDNLRYDYKHELALFRVSQELLNNSLKHAEASHIELKLDCKPSYIALHYEDNGIGFNMDEVLKRDGMSSGLGLKNIESRLSVAPTELNFDTAPQKGTRVHIRMTTSAKATITDQEENLFLTTDED